MGDLEDALVAGHQSSGDQGLDELVVGRRDEPSRDAGPDGLALGAGRDQPQDQVAQLPALLGLDPPVELLGGLGDGAVDAAGGAVAVDGEGVPLATLPRLEQCVREQGQGAGVVAHLVHEEVDQPVLDDQARLLGGAFDRLPQAVLVEGADEVQAALHQAG